MNFGDSRRFFEQLKEATPERIYEILRRRRPKDRHRLAAYIPRRVEGDFVDEVVNADLRSVLVKIRGACERLPQGSARKALLHSCHRSREILEEQRSSVHVLLDSANPTPVFATVDFEKSRESVGNLLAATHGADVVHRIREALSQAFPTVDRSVFEALRFRLARNDVSGTSWMLAAAVRAVAALMPNAWERWRDTLSVKGPVGVTGCLTPEGDVQPVGALNEKLKHVAEASGHEGVCLIPAAQANGKLSKEVPDKLAGRVVPVANLTTFVRQVRLAGRLEVGNQNEQIQRGKTKVDCYWRERELTDDDLLPLVLRQESDERAKEEGVDGKVAAEGSHSNDARDKDEESVEAVEFGQRIASELNNDARLLVVGPPGMGKSFTLAAIHGELLRSGRRLSLLLTSGELESAVSRSGKQGLDLGEIAGFDAWLSPDGRDVRSRYVLCVDGLDELSMAAFNATCTLMENWPGPVVATSRRRRAEHRRLQLFQRYSLKLPGEGDLRDYFAGRDLEAFGELLTSSASEGSALTQQLAKTPLGLELLIEHPEVVKKQGYEALEIIEKLIDTRVRSTRHRDSSRLPDRAWDWWRTGGYAVFEKVALMVVREGRVSLRSEDLSSVLDEAPSTDAAIFLDSGALTEPVDDRSWVFIHRVFVEALAARRFARSDEKTQCAIIRSACDPISELSEHFLELAASAIDEGSHLVEELLNTEERPLYALRLALKVAAIATLEDDELVSELAMRAFPWAVMSAKHCSGYEQDRVPMEVEWQMMNVPNSSDWLRFVEQHRDLLRPKWQAIASVLPGVGRECESDDEMIAGQLSARWEKLGVHFLRTMKPELSLARRLTIDFQWFDQSDFGELESLATPFRCEDLFDWKQVWPKEKTPTHFHGWETIYVPRMVYAWLKVVDDEERKRWAHHLPSMFDEMYSVNCDVAGRCIVIILRALLRSGTRLERWRAVFAACLSVEEGSDERQWPYFETCDEAEELVVSSNASRRGIVRSQAGTDEIGNLTAQLLTSVVTENSSSVLRHNWIMTRLAMNSTDDPYGTVTYCARYHRNMRSNRIFPDVLRWLKSASGIERRSEASVEGFRDLDPALILRKHLASEHRLLRNQAALLLVADGWRDLLSVMHELCDSEDAADRWVGYACQVLHRGSDVEQPLPLEVVKMLMSSELGNPTSREDMEETEAKLLTAWGATARRFMVAWLKEQEFAPNDVPFWSFEQEDLDRLAELWPEFQWAQNSRTNLRQVAVEHQSGGHEFDTSERKEEVRSHAEALKSLSGEELYGEIAKMLENVPSREATMENRYQWLTPRREALPYLVKNGEIYVIVESLTEGLQERLASTVGVVEFVGEVCNWPGIRLFQALRLFCFGVNVPSNLEILNSESEAHFQRILSSTDEEEEIQEAFEVFPERRRSLSLGIAISDTFQRLRELLGMRLLVIAPERTLGEFHHYEVDRFRKGLALSDRRVLLEELLDLWRSGGVEPKLEREVFRHLQHLMPPKLLLDELQDCTEERLERIAGHVSPDYFGGFLQECVEEKAWSDEVRADVAKGVLIHMPTEGAGAIDALEQAIKWADEGLVELQKEGWRVERIRDNVALGILSVSIQERLTEMLESNSTDRQLQALVVCTGCRNAHSFIERQAKPSEVNALRRMMLCQERLLEFVEEYAPLAREWHIFDEYSFEKNAETRIFALALGALVTYGDEDAIEELKKMDGLGSYGAVWLIKRCGTKPEHLELVWPYLFRTTGAREIGDYLQNSVECTESSARRLLFYGLQHLEEWDGESDNDLAHRMKLLGIYLIAYPCEIPPRFWERWVKWLDDVIARGSFESSWDSRPLWSLVARLHTLSPTECERALLSIESSLMEKSF